MASKFLSAPWDGGGVSFPDVQLYYLASQLSHYLRWSSEDVGRVQTLVIAPFNSKYSHPLHLLFCGPHHTGSELRNHPILRQALTVWHKVRTFYYTDGFDAYTPLWHCKRIPEFLNLSYDVPWCTHGVWHLSQICTETGIKPLPELQAEFHLPSSQLFTYLRVKHAFLSQFGHQGVAFENFPIPSLLLSPPSRHVTSILYSRLLGRE